jgi:hypothetical protein
VVLLVWTVTTRLDFNMIPLFDDPLKICYNVVMVSLSTVDGTVTPAL